MENDMSKTGIEALIKVPVAVLFQNREEALAARERFVQSICSIGKCQHVFTEGLMHQWTVFVTGVESAVHFEEHVDRYFKKKLRLISAHSVTFHDPESPWGERPS